MRHSRMPAHPLSSKLASKNIAYTKQPYQIVSWQAH